MSARLAQHCHDRKPLAFNGYKQAVSQFLHLFQDVLPFNSMAVCCTVMYDGYRIEMEKPACANYGTISKGHAQKRPAPSSIPNDCSLHRKRKENGVKERKEKSLSSPAQSRWMENNNNNNQKKRIENFFNQLVVLYLYVYGWWMGCWRYTPVKLKRIIPKLETIPVSLLWTLFISLRFPQSFHVKWVVYIIK